MKKILYTLALSLLAVSCVYDSDDPCRRTDYNLAQFNISLFSCTSNAVVAFMTNIDNKNKDYILTPGFDTTLVARSFYDDDSFGNMNDIAIQPNTADSTWTFASITDEGPDFVGTIRMSERDKNQFPVFVVDMYGSYDEGDGFTAEFRTDGELKYYWVLQSVYNRQYDYANMSWMLFREGTVLMTTYYQGKKLDTSKIDFYSEGDISYGNI